MSARPCPKDVHFAPTGESLGYGSLLRRVRGSPWRGGALLLRLRPETDLAAALGEMTSAGSACALVMDGEELVGLLTRLAPRVDGESYNRLAAMAVTEGPNKDLIAKLVAALPKPVQ